MVRRIEILKFVCIRGEASIPEGDAVVEGLLSWIERALVSPSVEYENPYVISRDASL
jgi:hypothetical protein